MASQYAPKTSIRQVRGALINRVLRKHSIDLDMKIEIVKPAAVEEIYRKLQLLPPEQLLAVERDFATITELAAKQGSEAILREASGKALDFTDIFTQARNGYERACWTFLEHPAIFHLALCAHAMDSHSAGCWDRRFAGHGLALATDGEALAHLSKLIRESYAKEGRGEFCHVDYYPRTNPDRHCFFAYPQDHPALETAYDAEGNLIHKPRKALWR